MEDFRSMKHLVVFRSVQILLVLESVQAQTQGQGLKGKELDALNLMVWGSIRVGTQG